MTSAATMIDPTKVEAFRRDGFVRLEGLLAADEVAALGRSVDAAVAARTRNDARTLAEK